MTTPIRSRLSHDRTSRQPAPSECSPGPSGYAVLIRPFPCVVLENSERERGAALRTGPEAVREQTHGHKLPFAGLSVACRPGAVPVDRRNRPLSSSSIAEPVATGIGRTPRWPAYAMLHSRPQAVRATDRSGGAAFVPMVQSAHLPDGNDAPALLILDGPRLGGVLFE